MDNLVKALLPAFAAGFAVQQLLEIIDSIIVNKILGTEVKKAVLAGVSLIVGLALAYSANLRVLEPLGVATADIWDIIVTGLIISAGTEGFNSIMKFLSYAKESKKVDATVKKAQAKV
jgi:hypothetical protein